MNQSNRFFSGREAALAYALTAERLFGEDGSFLSANQAVIPIFVNQLFQSLEISIKYAGIESGKLGKLGTLPNGTSLRVRSMISVPVLNLFHYMPRRGK